MLSNQDKKEMLEMVARCAELADEKYYRGIGPMSEFVRLLRIRGQSMDFHDSKVIDLDFPQDKPKKKMPDGEYAECKDCVDKPGSPTLCDVCLHNRALVGRLQEENRKLNNIVTKLSEPL